MLTVKRSQANSLATTNYAGESQQVGNSDTQCGQGGVVGGTRPELTEDWKQTCASQMLSKGREWGKWLIIHRGETEAQRRAGPCQTFESSQELKTNLEGVSTVAIKDGLCQNQ